MQRQPQDWTAYYLSMHKTPTSINFDSKLKSKFYGQNQVFNKFFIQNSNIKIWWMKNNKTISFSSLLHSFLGFTVFKIWFCLNCNESVFYEPENLVQTGISCFRKNQPVFQRFLNPWLSTTVENAGIKKHKRGNKNRTKNMGIHRNQTAFFTHKQPEILKASLE
jgi:hypothetical protein